VFRWDRRQDDLLNGSFGACSAALPILCAEEDMLLFSSTARGQLKTKYNLDATDAWLDRRIKSSVGFNSGDSGSFVVADVLVKG